jgi:hypothetical protein
VELYEDKITPDQVRAAFYDVAEGKVWTWFLGRERGLMVAVCDATGFTRVVDSGSFD